MAVIVGMSMAVLVRWRMITRVVCTCEVMLMKMKKAQQKQHEDQARHEPGHCKINACSRSQGRVGNQMEKRHPQHQTGHQAHDQLGPGVGHVQATRQPPPKQARAKNSGYVNQQKYRCGAHKLTMLSR